MSIHLENKDLINTQQLEVAVNGPDGATHLILCTGLAELSFAENEIYTFCTGPKLSRRQFVGAIASGALATIQAHKNESDVVETVIGLRAKIVTINANYDDESGQVKVWAEVLSSAGMTGLAISYNVSILAELPKR